MVEKIESRAWYLRQPTARAEVFRLLTECRALTKQEKRSWHDLFHEDSDREMPGVGEDITITSLAVLAGEVVTYLGIADQRASLFEATGNTGKEQRPSTAPRPRQLPGHGALCGELQDAQPSTPGVRRPLSPKVFALIINPGPRRPCPR